MTPEILAPAGSRESLIAAVRCGANAVYFGGKMFNARRNATNFADDEIAEVISYCHKHGVKVYITLNTLITDKELKDALKEITLWTNAGVDAFIIQDLGLASMVRQVCPSVAMHASTQMSVQSKYGFDVLKDIGFVRAVVPRELSKKEIAEIHAYSDLDIEAFVHGALCMCVSGQCLMSSVIGGRSGNRGLCAQPCRLPFGVNGKGGNNLSLKDLSLVDKIGELSEAGVVSLKIEGRMKRPEYVAAATTACRNAVNNKTDKAIDDSLGAVFSRSGFTDGYFVNKLGRDMFGIRTKEDVQNAPAVLKSLAHLYDNENAFIPVKMHFELKADKNATLTVSAMGFEATSQSESIPTIAINKPVTSEGAQERLSKCGGTQFYVSEFTCSIDEGLNMPASEMNALRRSVLAELENKIGYKPEANVKAYSFTNSAHKAGERKLHVRFFKEEQIPENVNAARVIIPLETSDETVTRLINQGLEVMPEIPVNVFSNGEKYIDNLLRMKALGVNSAWACNLDGLKIAQAAGLRVSSGFGMNILNTLAIEELQRLGAEDCLLSSEIAATTTKDLGGEMPRGIVAYGRLPLMVTRNCPVKNKINCNECKGESYLTDRMDVNFPVRCKNGCSFILNSVPLCVYDRKNDFKNIDFDLLYFTTETKNEAEGVIYSYYEEKAPDYDYTRGLYFRNVL